MSKSVKRVPLYKQIEQYIFDQMRLHDWKAHHKLPSETELASLFDVSRLTVKNALLNLMDKGLVYRIQGKGSYISDMSGEPVLYEASPADNKEKFIALILPLAKTIRSLHLINGIEEELSKHGYHLLLCKTYNSKEKEKQVLQDVLRLNVAGIIIYPVEGVTYSEDILRLTLNPYPLVIVDRYLRGIETNCVFSANSRGAYEAISHLIQLGHTKVGFVSTESKDTSSIEDRLAGYEQALADFKLPVEHRMRRTQFQLDQVNLMISEGRIDDSVKSEIQSFIKQNPDMTAIFAVNSALGLSVIETASDMGIRVPEDLSVCFFDDYEFSTFSRIAPTCVLQQEHLVGQEAVKLILSFIENPDQERRRVEIPTKLVIRKSTAPMGVHAP
ncbi:GntR family transcriptional regulator [Paenibacillus filicis]|uniref:GntR family transcriptional regulator n=1 Tax=Paenibacillus gyeongsangnamensis TaxID=3388067 RepID=A0ABT4Q3Y4_9BACL|nr:GntR family transcriptional regulator [Paenibacillus filicis]MCZ8511528.1 GntR family transcriptional regulator [Paenibacillus filicis]